MLDHHNPAATITVTSAQAFHWRLDQIRPAAQTKLASKSASWMLQITPAVAIKAASTKATCLRRETVRFGKVVTLRTPYCDLFLQRSLNFNRTLRVYIRRGQGKNPAARHPAAIQQVIISCKWLPIAARPSGPVSFRA